MANATVKYALTMLSGLVAGALIAIPVWQHYAGGAAGATQASATTSEPAANEPKVLYWYDPMKPDVHFDKPGKSPFMNMDLVPKYEGQGGSDGASVTIDPTQVQNLGLKTAQVVKAPLLYTQTLPANVSYNEYQYAIVQARSSGFVERVAPLTVGDHITRGTPLIEVTIPEWVEAQSEYLLLHSTGGTATQLNGILERLRLAGMPEADIARLKSSQRIQTRFTIRAPIDGVITGFDLRAGMNITTANVIAKIQGIDPVWVSAQVPESVAYLINEKTHFELTVPAYPNEHFTVAQWRVLPALDASTRTVQVRLLVENPERHLKPGMNATLTLKAESEPQLLIPSQAVIDTGKEQRVITVDNEGHFVPKRIRVSHERGGQAAVAEGLSEAESVVVSGLFLIDSEANISGALERMRKAPAAATAEDMDWEALANMAGVQLNDAPDAASAAASAAGDAEEHPATQNTASQLEPAKHPGEHQ